MGAEVSVRSLGFRCEISGRSDWLPPFVAEAGVGLAASHCSGDDDAECKVAKRTNPPTTAAAEEPKATALPFNPAERGAFFAEDEACRMS